MDPVMSETLWAIFSCCFHIGSVVLEPPSITSMISTTTTIEIRWSAPTSTNFDDYLIMYQGINVDVVQKNVTVDTSVTMVSLPDLTPGETYRISVAAINGTDMAISTAQTVTTSKYWDYFLKFKYIYGVNCNSGGRGLDVVKEMLKYTLPFLI